MQDKTRRMFVILSVCAITVALSAGTASAVKLNHGAVDQVLAGDSCTVTEDSPSCEYDCQPLQYLSVSASSSAFGSVDISTSCGGESTQCSGSTSCSRTSDRVHSPGTGTCQLHDGKSGSCGASYSGNLYA